MMESQDLPAHENLAQCLGLKPGYCSFLVQATTGLRLESKSIKDVHVGGGAVYFLETRPPVFLDGYLAILDGFGRADNL